MDRTVSLSAGPLCIRFQSFQDRLSHTIELQCGDISIPLLESIEGSPADPWPVSPPMQQMVEECIGPGASPVLLGVGLSGNGHWSAAIESHADSTLKLDIACKNSKPSTWFGSRYRVLTEGMPGDATTFNLHSNSLVDPAGQSPWPIEVKVLIGSLHFCPGDQALTIRPDSSPETAMTHRWCFQVRIQ